MCPSSPPLWPVAGTGLNHLELTELRQNRVKQLVSTLQMADHLPPQFSEPMYPTELKTLVVVEWVMS